MLDEITRVEYVIMAEHVEVINGKFYMMGAGWNQMGLQTYAQPVQLKMAIRILMPWNKANIKMPFRMSVVDSDGHEVMPPYQNHVLAGRPTNAVYGQPIPLPIALETIVVFPQKGVYAVVAEVTDDGTTSHYITRFSIYAQGEEPV